MAVNCGDCLCNDVQIVELVDGKCPRCGADYGKIIFPSEETFDRQPLPRKIKGRKIRIR